MNNIKKNMLCKTMSENLVLLRTSLKLSQQELADLIGVTRQTISSFENKTREMSWYMFLAFLMIFTSHSQTYNLLGTLQLYNDKIKEELL